MKKKIWLLCTLICFLLVGSMTVSAATFSLSQTRVTLNIGDSAELSVVGSEELAKWASYNVNIATVDQSGKVTAVRKGSTTISARIGLTYKKCTVKVVDSSIKVNKPTAVIYTGGTSTQTVQLRATVKGASKAVTWTSLNPTVATVDEKGKVTSVSAGQAVIMATANGKTDTCVVKVLKNSISLNMDTMQLGTKGNGSAIKLTPTIVGTGKSVKWTTSDKTVATVSGGRVTGKNTGTAIITATANGVSATCEVTVIKDSLSISEEKVLLYTGETKQIRSNATRKEVVVWESSNDNVVTVDEKGKLTAVGEGTATIRISLSNAAAGTVSRDTTDTCEVTVKDSRMEIYNEEVSLKTKGTDKTCTLSYQVTGRRNTIRWTTSNSKVVSVSGGKLTAKSVGTATVTATANGVSDTVEVTVSAYEPTITLSQKEYTLYTKKGNTVTLRATIDGPVKKAVWESSRPEVATVVNGKVTAVGEGETIITATANDVVAECRITVKESKVILETENITMDKGATAQLAADVVGYSQSLSYASTNTKVVTVRNGVLTAKNYGEADIKVTANGVTSLCHVKVAVCNHEYDKVVTDPTCTEKGYTTYTCKKCGDSYTGDYTEPLGHEFGEWETVKEATETETGLAKRSCKRCKEEETKSIPTTDHVHKYTEVVTEPTCTEKGYTTHTCACGDSYVDTYTNALGHDYEEKVFPPTCQNGGHSLFLCRRCGDAYMGNFTDLSEHSYVDTIVKPTCDVQGYTLHTCSACGNEYRDHYVESLGHDYGEWKVTKEATETETGEQVRTCKRCNKEQTEEIPVKIHVHQYTAVVTTEPTCEQPGITTYTCTSCGHKYIDYVPAALGHDYVAKVVKEATCDDLGEVLYTCSRCGDSYTEQLDPLDHVFGEEVVTPPTCEKKGYTTRTCINCGHQIKDNYIDALGHEFGEWETVTEPTEDSMGLMKRQCIRCEETETKMIPALDHVHQYTDTVTAPTCTEKGYTTHTCKCGNSYVDTYTDALGHDYEDVVTEPTCTEKGSTTHTCKRCGYTCTNSETAALGHDYEDVVTEPTCGEQGYTTHTCKRCQDTYVDSYVDPTGAHDDGEWVVAKQPDVGVAGLKELRCTKCGYVLATEEIGMLTTDGVDSVYYIDVQDADGTLRKEMVVGHYNREEAQEMLNFVNEYRASINQSTLKMTSETMNDYVDMRAAETSYLWDHARPNGGRTSYSENIAQGNPDIKGETPSVEQIFNAWLASEGHKANLDAPRDIDGLTGISVFYKKCPVYKDGKETGQYVYTAYWVEIFK